MSRPSRLRRLSDIEAWFLSEGGGWTGRPCPAPVPAQGYGTVGNGTRLAPLVGRPRPRSLPSPVGLALGGVPGACPESSRSRAAARPGPTPLSLSGELGE